MTTMQKIKEIEDEMARTQKNKATSGHLGMLKVKMSPVWSPPSKYSPFSCVVNLEAMVQNKDPTSQDDKLIIGMSCCR